MNRTVRKGEGSVADPENGPGPNQPDDGFVQICGDVVFHLDVLKLTLRKGDASDAPFNAKAKKQMSLDLENLW